MAQTVEFSGDHALKPASLLSISSSISSSCSASAVGRFVEPAAGIEPIAPSVNSNNTFSI